MPNLTLIDIAELAGVSRSTVSRVLNEQPNVSGEVRERVLAVIKETGFQPNMAARSLRSKRSGILGLVIPESVHTLFTDPYFVQLTQGATQGCNLYGKTLALFVESNEDTLIPRVTRGGHLDGVLVQVGQINNRLVPALIEAKVPFVAAGRPADPKNLSYIDVDNVSAAYNAVIHLIRLGYQRIAHITGNLAMGGGQDRLLGYKRALQDRGLVVDPELIAEGDFRELGGYMAAQYLISKKPDAVFVASDLMARSTIRAFQEAGLSVPKDIAVVGFDDLPPAIEESPYLTTVRQPIIEFGLQAVSMLVDVIEHGMEYPHQMILGAELVVRESCGAKLKGVSVGQHRSLSRSSDNLAPTS